MIERKVDSLIAGEGLIHKSVTIASGEVLERSAVLGKVTADGTYKLAKSDADDGSETPNAILAEDVDATAGAVSNVNVIIRGEVNDKALILDSSFSISDIEEGLREKGIYIKSGLAAAN